MSQNRTVFPGVEPEGRNPKDNYRTTGENYSHSHRTESKGTVFPEMGSDRHEYAHANPSNRRQQSKPIVGFLYSVSKTGFGEYWPIHIGANTIGRSSKCDIQLLEGTVSEEHASIVVRIMKNPQKLDASISDERSSHGTMVNGESISATRPLECQNGDIITFGESYQLYLILIDAKAIGLNVAENFIDVSDQEDDNDFIYENTSGSTRITEDFPPRFTGTRSNNSPQGNASSYDGTVGLDGGNQGSFRKGGTEF